MGTTVIHTAGRPQNISVFSIHDRKHAGQHTITTALSRIIAKQVAAFHRPVRPTPTGRAIATVKHSHYHESFGPGNLPSVYPHRDSRNNQPACESTYMGAT